MPSLIRVLDVLALKHISVPWSTARPSSIVPLVPAPLRIDPCDGHHAYTLLPELAVAAVLPRAVHRHASWLVTSQCCSYRANHIVHLPGAQLGCRQLAGFSSVPHGAAANGLPTAKMPLAAA